MKISRTVLLRSSGLLAMAMVWSLRSGGQQQTEEQLSIKPVATDFFVIEGTSTGASDAGNIGVYVTGEGVILVDDRFDRNYRQVLAAVRSVTTQPVRYVVNTHHHGDHTGGNAAFLQANVEVAAHANARRHMAEGNMPGQPRIVFTQEASIFLGGKEVRMLYCGRGHTDGDIAVYIPQSRQCTWAT